MEKVRRASRQNSRAKGLAGVGSKIKTSKFQVSRKKRGKGKRKGDHGTSNFGAAVQGGSRWERGQTPARNEKAQRGN